MKSVRILVTLAMVFAMVTAVSPVTFAYQPVSVVVDNVKLEAEAYVVDDRTVVPLRAIFNALNATVDWNAETSTVTAMRGSKVIQLTVGQREATINGQQTILGVPPMLINDRTFIPLRFVSEALGGSVDFNDATQTVYVKGEVQIQAGVTHKGTIKPEGETWLAAESPHFVKGVFRVEGKTNPVLTIEAGAKVYFENGGQLLIGDQAPGGLVANGTATNRIVFTADSTNPQAGFWKGIKFRPLTLANNDLNSPKSIIQGTTIEYAGGNDEGSAAIRMEGEASLVEVILKDLEIKNSLYAGVSTYHNAKIHPVSDNLRITGTKANSKGGGYAFQVDPSSSHNLPYGQYTDNDINAIHLTSWSWGKGIAENTTWRNLGIPYVTKMNLEVGSDISPTLTIEPGVVVAFGSETCLRVGYVKPGALVADAGANLSRAELDAGLKAWQSWATNPKSTIPSTNKAIVFAPWNAKPAPGAWNGIVFKEYSGTDNKLNGTVVAYGGKDNTWPAGIWGDSSSKAAVALTLSNSLITNSGFNGVQLSGQNTRFNPGSTGNYYEGNQQRPLRVMPNAVGSIEPGSHFGVDDVIYVWNGTTNPRVTQTQTWFNHGIPYFVECRIIVGGIEKLKPITLTIEPGVNLTFAGDMALTIGEGQSDPGILKAVGTADSPITFSSVGTWRGIYLAQYANNSSLIQYALVENATYNIKVNKDLGKIITNTTIQNAPEYGILREYRGGTDFTSADLQNIFSGNVKGNQK